MVKYKQKKKVEVEPEKGFIFQVSILPVTVAAIKETRISLATLSHNLPENQYEINQIERPKMKTLKVHREGGVSGMKVHREGGVSGMKVHREGGVSGMKVHKEGGVSGMRIDYSGKLQISPSQLTV